MAEAADKLIEAEGLTVIRPGEKESLLDTLWSDSEDKRLLHLLYYTPTLMTHPERVMAKTLEKIRYRRFLSGEGVQPDLPCLSEADQLALDICDDALDEDLLATGISDTFADEFLAAGGELENTKALKDAVRSMREKLGPNADRENP
jgi:hypothetical protein